MIMTTHHGHLLLPVKPRFIVWSLLLALMAEAALLLGTGRSGVWLPDVLLLVILYWALYQPQRVGLGWAFALGLCADMLNYGLLGQHALTYVVVISLVQWFHRRLKQFSALEQVPQVLLALAIGQLLFIAVGVLAGLTWPGWASVFKPFLEALLWAPLAWLLQAPQRRPLDPDVHRPL